MDKNLLAKALMTLFCFGFWPAFARKSGMPSAWITLFLGITLVITAVTMFSTMVKQSLPVSEKGTILLPSILILCIGVGLNAIGSVSFTTIISSKNPDAFAYIALVVAGVPVIIKIAGLLLDPHEQISWINVIGLIGTMIFIPLIMYKKDS
jgi:hypothetical protein